MHNLIITKKMNFTALLKFYNRTPNLPYERLNMYEIWNVFRVYTSQKEVFLQINCGEIFLVQFDALNIGEYSQEEMVILS